MIEVCFCIPIMIWASVMILRIDYLLTQIREEVKKK